nr:sigma-54-dependent Fis family transcriptional regulator [Ramlibacter cellulosilyticus]
MPLAREGPVASGTLPIAEPQHVEAISRSHERCEALGLSRRDRPEHARVARAELAAARERNLRLHLHAAPLMEILLEQIMATQSMVVLTDAQGTVLHSVGHDDFLQRASRVALAPGANWSEASKGTNAIGTALVNEAPTVVHAGEHFIHANGFLTCSAAPILDPRGNLLGVLDVSGEHHSYHLHTLGLVKMSARMIENHWLSDDFRNGLRLHFHGRPEFIGTLMEGIVAVDHDGRLQGANRSALEQLHCSGAALRMQSTLSLFGVAVGAIVDHFRSPIAPPMVLNLPDGRTLHMRAAFSWPAWQALGAPQAQAQAPLDIAPPVAAAGSLYAAAVGLRAPAQGNSGISGLHYLRTGDAQMEAVVAKVRRVLDRDISILVLGETGTGKELLARAIHHDSARSRQPFVAVNCASIPENLIESELFGYEDGAFTGARRKGAPGKIVQAHGGTLFLDEIGDMPLALQARLLRVLQERQVTPLGSTRSLPVDVAVVSATHRDLSAMIAAGTFRQDLYYRLNGLVVKLPALRERSDLMVIVQKILRAETEGRPLALHEEVAALLQAYRWPGNIRQLANVLRTAAVMAGGERTITREHLSDDFLEDAQRALPETAASSRGTLEDLQLATIRRALEEAGGNISVAAKKLGISRNTIYRRLRWGDGEPS